MTQQELERLFNEGALRGMYRDVSNRDYHNGVGVSSSTLKLYLNHSPKKALYRSKNKEQTPAMMLGTAVHELVFESDKFRQHYIVAPEGMKRDARHKAYQEFLEQANGKEVLSQQEYALISGMADSCKSHPIVKQIMEDAIFESSCYWQDGGCLLKCRPDCLTADGMLFDLKTVKTANPFIFGADAIKLGYDLSAAMYVDGLMECGIDARTMHFILVEKEPPYDIAIRHFTPAEIELGRLKYKYALDIYRHCATTGEYQGYPEESQAICVPPWAYQWKPEAPTYAPELAEVE